VQPKNTPTRRREELSSQKFPLNAKRLPAKAAPAGIARGHKSDEAWFVLVCLGFGTKHTGRMAVLK
jgi:hypothetical protein